MNREVLWNANYIKVFFSNFLLNFAFMLLTPLLPLYLQETYGANKDLIGLVLSGYAIAALVVRPFSGYIVDVFPRKVVLLVSYFLTSIIFGGYLIAGTITIFAIFRTLHGAPFGATGVSLSTVMIDVLPSSRRNEGIGYFGLSNNVATAIAPAVALAVFALFHNYDVLFGLAMLCSLLGLIIDATIHIPPKNRAEINNNSPLALPQKRIISLDRFFLLRGWALFISMFTFAFSFGVLSTFVAIYGKQELGIFGGTGVFFALLAIGLIISRLTGSKSLAKGKIIQNATAGIIVSAIGYVLFAFAKNKVGYYLTPFIIGLGNGHMWPAFQTMFIELATHNQRGTANSTLLVSWDLGIGMGMLVGGIFAENINFQSAFICGAMVNLMGLGFFLTYAKNHYLRNKIVEES